MRHILNIPNCTYLQSPACSGALLLFWECPDLGVLLSPIKLLCHRVTKRLTDLMAPNWTSKFQNFKFFLLNVSSFFFSFLALHSPNWWFLILAMVSTNHHPLTGRFVAVFRLQITIRMCSSQALRMTKKAWWMICCLCGWLVEVPSCLCLELAVVALSFEIIVWK